MTFTLTKLRPNWAAAFVALAAFAAFAPCFGFALLEWDDDSHLLFNPALAELSLSGLRRIWTTIHYEMFVPVSYTFWFAVAALGGVVSGAPGEMRFPPWLFHGANVVLHALNCALVFRLTHEILTSKARNEAEKEATAAALIGSLVFAIHPLRVEAVAWIAEARDLLATTFALLTMRSFSTSQRNGWKFGSYALSIGLYTMGFLAKPGIAMLPVVLAFFTDFSPVKRRQAALRLAPFFILSGVIYLMTIDLQGTARMAYTPPFWARPLIAIDSLVFYLEKFITPLSLSPDYGRGYKHVVETGAWIPATLVFAALLTAALLTWEKSRDLFLMLVLFCIATLPTSGLVPFRFQQISTTADHYAYFGGVFLAPLVGLVWSRTGRILKPLILFWCLGLLFIQAGYCAKWVSIDALFSHVMKVNPRSHAFLTVTGHRAFKDRDYPRAIALYRQALAIDDDLVETRNNLALALYNSGQTETAITELTILAKKEGVKPLMLVNLAMMLNIAGRPVDSLMILNRVIRDYPDLPEAHLQLGFSLRRLGQPVEAEVEIELAYRSKPSLKDKKRSTENPAWYSP